MDKNLFSAWPYVALAVLVWMDVVYTTGIVAHLASHGMLDYFAMMALVVATGFALYLAAHGFAKAIINGLNPVQNKAEEKDTRS